MRFIVLLFFINACCSISVQAAPAQDQLFHIPNAVNALNYDANLVLQKGSSMESIRVIHVHQDGTIFERISYETGVDRTIVRTGEQVSFSGSEDAVHSGNSLRNPLLAFSPNNVQLLEKNYTVKLLGQQRVAGQSCDQIAIVPHVNDRYRHRICIDPNHGLALSIETFNTDNKKIDALMVTHITYEPSVDNALFQHSEPMYHIKMQPVSDESAQHVNTMKSQWKINWLPEGFALQASMQKQSERFQVPVDYFMYHDGLVNLSIYFESSTSESTAKPHFYQQGKTVLYQHEKFGYLVTLVAELPPSTLVRIAESIDNPKLREAIQQIEHP